MDVITHGLAGGLIARAAVGRGGGTGVVAAVAGALSPDVDVVARLWHPMASIVLHRGPTHSLAGGVVLALAVGAVVGAATGRRFSAMTGLAYLGVLSHLLLDLFTPFGTAVLWPFDPTRRSVGSLHVIDPVVTLVILGGLLPSAWWRRSARAVARASLLGLAVYLLLSVLVMQVAQWRWIGAVLEGEAAGGRAVVVPGFPGPFRWLGVAETSGGIIRSRFWLWQVDGTPRTVITSAPVPPDAPDLEHSPAVKAFGERATFLHRRTTRIADGWVIEYEDLAFLGPSTRGPDDPPGKGRTVGHRPARGTRSPALKQRHQGAVDGCTRLSRRAAAWRVSTGTRRAPGTRSRCYRNRHRPRQ